MAYPAIEVEHVHKGFKHVDALQGIDLQVPTGTVFALLGENGAGKTTLIKILTGFTHADAGSCRVLGMNPETEALAIRRRIGYVADAPAMYDWMRVAEIGWFASSFYPKGFLERFVKLVEGFEVSLVQKIKHLSKGQRAKVALALAIAHEPDLLILDEPTSGLDPLVRRQFLESMVDRAATGRTVLLSSHQINEVERVADWVAIIHRGKVKISKPIDELKEDVVQWRLTLENPQVAFPRLQAEVLVEQRDGRQCRLVVANPSPDDLSALRNSTGVTGVDEQRLSLEEIFIACTRPTADDPRDAPGHRLTGVA